jgi:hypothetical protein
MDAKRTERLALQILEAINARDYSQINQLTGTEVQIRLPPSEVFYGRDGVREFFAVLETRLPTLLVTARKVHAGHDFAVVEYDAAADDLDAMGALVLEFDGERVERVQLYLDTAQWAALAERRR